MPMTVIDSDCYVNGQFSARTQVLASSSVSAESVEANAGIEASKLQHQHEITLAISDHDQVPGATRRVIHRVKGATGEIVQFAAGSTVLAGAATTTSVQLKKNGTNVLTSAIELDSTNTAYVAEAAAGYTSTSLVTGDVLEVDVTGSGDNEPKGLFCSLVVREDAQ